MTGCSMLEDRGGRAPVARSPGAGDGAKMARSTDQPRSRKRRGCGGRPRAPLPGEEEGAAAAREGAERATRSPGIGEISPPRRRVRPSSGSRSTSPGLTGQTAVAVDVIRLTRGGLNAFRPRRRARGGSGEFGTAARAQFGAVMAGRYRQRAGAGGGRVMRGPAQARRSGRR